MSPLSPPGRGLLLHDWRSCPSALKDRQLEENVMRRLILAALLATAACNQPAAEAPPAATGGAEAYDMAASRA